MRQATLALMVLTLAALACNLPSATSSPTPAPPLPPPSTPPATPVVSPGGVYATELTPEQIEQIVRAAVQIVAARPAGSTYDPLWSGSGTIISPDGEIVTNCHVACGAPLLIISLTTDPDQPPEPRYLAQITHYDEEIDLAILRITHDVKGNPVSPTDLPYLPMGNSDELRLGDKIYIFGYPGVGGETITFTTGSVSGFESAEVAGVSQRVIIKTDAEIASGNSGGTAVDLLGRLVAVPTAVNPDVREGVTLGGLGILRPINLVAVVRQRAGTPPVEEAGLPPKSDPDPYEPNDTLDQAVGPLAPGDVISAYISWPDDVDVFWFTTSTAAPIEAALSNIPPGTDYDLYLLDSNGDVIGASENEIGDEYISYAPRAAGSYWVAVVAYQGSSVSTAYSLTVNYDSGAAAAGGIVITGRAIDGATGRPLAGGVFGILRPDVSCARFFSGAELDLRLVTAYSETNNAGYFRLDGVPRGATYAAFFVYGANRVCEDGWLEVPSDAIDTDLGDIEMSFN